jgi:hypothetical protein
MDPIFWLIVLTGVAALGTFAYFMARPTLARDAAEDRVWADFRAVAAEVGGLEVEQTASGWPRLRGIADSIAIEIDCENAVSRGLDGMLGLRCRIPNGEAAPSAALWIGDVDALRTQYGRPRPSGDSAGLFDVYTRVEPSASDWWQDPALHEALTLLPGAGLVLDEGSLTVLFTKLDSDSVRTAMRIPGLVHQGAQRVTLH